MSDKPQNPYSELMQETQRRVKELAVAGCPPSWSPQAIEWCEAFSAVLAEYERRFVDLLANRQGTIMPDFDVLYRRKAELDP
jgi:hypothetical protein